MAGSPGFTRAKHFRHFHTDHTSQFDGAETQHVKTNLTASIDGDYELKADKAVFNVDNASIDGDLDIKRNKLLNPKNVLRAEKVTILPANLTASANTQTIALFRASPGDTVYDVNGNVRTSFKEGSDIDDNLVFEMGDKDDVNGFGISHAASPIGWIWDGQDGAEKGVYLRGTGASPIRRYKTYATATLINVKLSAADSNLASLTAGAVDFYIDVMSRA